ncbi:hypothetical protein [Salinicoccus roseus]|uniref:Uncharacterized protein n=1 Tax=Salinicoccus roseus TaxID=45670 RepID=A0A265E7F5_9STAP|nr:hypothetical protein [Salinicoccus roseus]OZT77514.1 hypothetical protein CFN03_06130 [Salinicoccus roseus]
MYELELLDSPYNMSNIIPDIAGISIIEEEIPLDSGRYKYYFRVTHDMDGYEDEYYRYINVLFLEMINGIHLVLSLPLLKIEYSVHTIYNVKLYNEAYNNMDLVKFEPPDHAHNNFRISQNQETYQDILKLCKSSQYLRDIFILLSKVKKFPDTQFINGYKLYDFGTSFNKYLGQLSWSIDTKDLQASIKHFKANHNKHINNYVSSGLLSRHGLSANSVKDTNYINNDYSIVEDSIDMVWKIIFILLNNSVNIDDMESAK